LLLFWLLLSYPYLPLLTESPETLLKLMDGVGSFVGIILILQTFFSIN